MLNRVAILIPALFFFFPAAGQFDTSFVKGRLLNNADSLAYSFRTRNWEMYTRYSNPSMIGALGGKKEFISYINDMFATVPDSAWKLYQPGKILQVIRVGKDLQAVIELNSIVEWQGMRASSTAYLVGESWTDGYTWTFFDSQGDPSASRIILPNLSDQLIIPAKNEKVEPIEVQKGPPFKPKNQQ